LSLNFCLLEPALVRSIEFSSWAWNKICARNQGTIKDKWGQKSIWMRVPLAILRTTWTSKAYRNISLHIPKEDPISQLYQQKKVVVGEGLSLPKNIN
jgi:hypothetical protein